MSRHPAGPTSSEKPGQRAAEFTQAVGEVAGRRALVDVGIPAADIDKAEIELLAHQPADPPRRQLESARRDRAAIGRGHFLRYRAVDVVADPKALRYRGSKIALRVHVLDQPGLTIVDARLAHAVDADVWNLGLAAKDQRKLVGEGDRPDAREFGRKPAHETRTIIARAAGRLAEFDRILGLEMAPCQVIGGPRERHKGNLTPGPQGMDAVAQGRVQSPLRAERQGRVWIAGIGLGDAERRPRTVIEVARYRHHDIGGIVSAAQKHHQQPRVGGRCGPDAARHRQREPGLQKP